MQIKPKQAPVAEAVTFDGTNVAEVTDLARRVLVDQVKAIEVRTNEPHLGINIYGDDDRQVVMVRVEEGNTLVYDPMRPPELSLFVLGPAEFDAFYEGA